MTQGSNQLTGFAQFAEKPLAFIRYMWPDIRLYDKQADIITSVWENTETFVHAAHQLGKDFTAGLIILTFFLTRNPARVMATSAESKQLDSALFGEIRNLVQLSRFPLAVEQGGPLELTYLRVRKIYKGQPDPKSEIAGHVAKNSAAVLGRHLPLAYGYLPSTLAVLDEASGIQDEIYERITTWSHRILAISNPYPTSNFFERLCKRGDVS